MRTPRPLPEGAAERLAAMLEEAHSKADYQRIQCVWLRAALGLRAAQIAIALGWQVGSVRQVHSDYLRQGEAVLRSNPSGGPSSPEPDPRARKGVAASFSRTGGDGWRAGRSPGASRL